MKYYVLLITSLLFLFSCQSNKENQGVGEMDSFINELMGKMTLEEKIGQLNLVTPGGGILTGSVVSTGVEEKIKAGQVGGIFGVYGPEKVRQAQELAVNGSRLRIPMLFGSDIIHGYKTTFPIPLGLSCSWDMELIEKTAHVAATEATADGIFWNFSPMVDISRDPRWGRVSEGAGEDPYLGSQIAKAMVKGYQGDDLKSPSTMMATVKHFALYGAVEAGRDYNSVDMSRQRMYNEYFPPYKAAIEAGVGCVMSSFNDVDGIPSSGNKWLLTDLLRDKWGFNGFVVSDYTSVNEMIAHGLGDLQEVSALALKAGLDMDMVGEGFLTTLEQSLEEGKISEADINKACRRVLEAKYKLGLFEDPYRYNDQSRPEKDILTKENREFAREAATKSMVLLKNEKQLLPLKKTGTIALIGPLANDQRNMLGTWAPTGDWKLSVPVLSGIKDIAGENTQILYAKGANISDDPEFAKNVNANGERIIIDERSPEVMIREAISVANSSDVIVAIVGESSEMSGESSNRSNIEIPESQKRLIRSLAKTSKPLVLVVLSGRPLAMTEEINLADAILYSGHLGVEAGNAIADVIFGDYNPSGKLTMTLPRNVGQVPIYYRSRTTGRPQEGDTFQKFKSNYLDVENSPLYPFGYGLSYAHFSYSDLKLSQDTITKQQNLTVSVTVLNDGSYDGEEVVQIYYRDLVASVTRPVKELSGFKKILLKAGEKENISFEINPSELGFYKNDMTYVTEPGDFIIYVGGNSEDNLKTKFTLLE